MTRGSITGALVGALLGAAGWGVLSWLTGYEIGIVAWAVGGLVGLLAYLGGGKGQGSGGLCAALALLAIFGGKMLAMEMMIRSEIKREYTLETYEGEMEAARALPRYEGDHAAFMLDAGLAVAPAPKDVPPAEVESFKRDYLPYLLELGAEQPSFEEWRRDQIAKVRGEVMAFRLVRENLGMMDILFAALGVITALRVGSGFETGG